MKFIIAIFLLFLVSCNSRVDENLINFEVDKSFDVSGSFSSEDGSYIYFAKRKFNPCVILFDEKGMKLDSISLSKAEQELSEITNVWMRSTDTVFVYSYFTNATVILDSKGEIRDVKKRQEIKDEMKQAYELYPPYGNIQSANNVIFTACLLKEYENNEYGSWESFSAYSKNMKNGYLAYKEDSGFGIKKSELEGFLDEDSILFLPFWQTTTANNQFIFNSKYSRYIYLLNNDLSVKRSVKIIPDSMRTMQPIKLHSNMGIADEIALISDAQNQTGYFINHIFYDKIKQNYIVSILNFDVITNYYFPYKFYIYDKSFKKINEVDIQNKNNYNGLNCFYINSCVLIEKIDNNDEEKRVFEAFKI